MASPLVRFTTYNTLDLFGSDSAAAREHYEMVVAVIRSVDPDVLAVQEILAPDGPTAAGGSGSSRTTRACAARLRVPWGGRLRSRWAATVTTWG